MNVKDMENVLACLILISPLRTPDFPDLDFQSSLIPGSTLSVPFIIF